jgi:glycosyltransferase involved in cell wall biosynthesis
MKILQIAPPWVDVPPKGYGGTENVIYNLTESLVKMGHSVTLFATGKSKTSGKLRYVFKESLYNKKVDWVAALPSLVHYKEAFKLAPDFDIVHLHLSSATDIMLLSFIDELTVPHVLTMHSLFPFDRFSFVDEQFLQRYGRSANVIAISKAVKKLIPREVKPIGYVYNGINMKDFSFNDKPKEYVTWLGKIKPIKGTHEAIEAAKSAGEKIVFAGVVDRYDKESSEYFEKKVKPLVDGDQVVYLGPADKKQKNEMLRNAKAFLNPICWEEPFGMVMAESMAAGTPVISYARGAAVELIKDGETGFLVENKREMIKALKKIGNIDRAMVRKHVEENFSAEAMAGGYVMQYEKQLAKHMVPVINTIGNIARDFRLALQQELGKI